MTPGEKITQTGVRLPESLLKELKIAAIEQDTSVNAIILELIKKYLSDYKKKG